MIWYAGFALCTLIAAGCFFAMWGKNESRQQYHFNNGMSWLIFGNVAWAFAGSLMCAIIADLGSEDKPEDTPVTYEIREFEDGSYVQRTEDGYSFYREKGPGFVLETIEAYEADIIESDTTEPAYIARSQAHGNQYWWPWTFDSDERTYELIVPSGSVK